MGEGRTLGELIGVDETREGEANWQGHLSFSLKYVELQPALYTTPMTSALQ